jgi:hypothetical protein
MQEQRGIPGETAGEVPAASRTQTTLHPKRGTTPALQATRHPGRKTPATRRLSTRDLRLLNWMGEQYAARMDHLQALTDTSTTAVWQIVRKLGHAGLVRKERIVAMEPSWVSPTAEGLAACGLPYGEWTPVLGRLEHVGAMNEVRIHMQTRTPDAHWISERQLMEEYAEVNAGRRGRSREHMPDGVAILDGSSMAIEVELSVKSNMRLEGILDELARRYDAILYFCAPSPYQQLTRMQRSGRWQTMGVRELPELPRPKSRY